MLSDPRFLGQPREFWADIRIISQICGYSVRGKDQLKIPSADEITAAYHGLDLSTDHLLTKGKLNESGEHVREYLTYRAKVLKEEVNPRLMTARDAKDLYLKLKRGHVGNSLAPMNKQKGKKKKVAYLTAITNMLIQSSIEGHECDFNPRVLTSITRGGRPLRTLARRVDGAFPSTTNPIALWEIKEYYYTTTFGSRIADGVYESLLDGMELEELREHTGIDVKHYLIVDAKHTWWDMGKSYLCRMVDMQHMGYVDEVLYGREVVERIPVLAQEWLQLLESGRPS